jgi:pyruvate, orthophosphate dikinase
MDGLPVTVRLLDPPLHEFLPDVEELLVAEARGSSTRRGTAPHRRSALAGGQPDARDPRLPARDPQAGAVPDAGPGAHRGRRRGPRAEGHPEIEIMVPLVVTARELALIGGWIREAAQEVVERTGVEVTYRSGR